MKFLHTVKFTFFGTQFYEYFTTHMYFMLDRIQNYSKTLKNSFVLTFLYFICLFLHLLNKCLLIYWVTWVNKVIGFRCIIL